MDQIGNILSSLSMLFAASAFLYAIWYNDIDRAVKVVLPLHYADGKAKHDDIKATLFIKAWPLAAFTIIFSFIFIPTSINIVCSWLKIVIDGQDAVYDPIRTAVVCANISFVLLAGYLTQLAWSVRKKHKKFEEKRRAE